MRAIRVLHCPTMVGGNPQGLARAERELGLQSWSVAFKRSFFDYDTDEVLFPDGRSQVVYEAKRWRLLWQAWKDFDILHFNAGQSIMPIWVPRDMAAGQEVHRLKREVFNYYAALFELRDLWLLKRVGKGIVVTFQGDDARQGDFCSSNFEVNPAQEVDSGYYSPASDEHKRYRINVFAKYADRVFALNPDLLHVLPTQSQFLPYANVDLNDWRPVDATNGGSRVPILVHAPSHRGVKGTRFVVEAVTRLRAEGLALEFIMVQGMSRSEARKIYERADLLIDQLLTGWYGGVAVELMALGNPVVCYIRESDLKFIPEEMRKELPIIRATPSSLYDVLKEWLTQRKDELPERGRLSRLYVERWHDPLKIAAKVKIEYEAIINSRPKQSPGLKAFCSKEKHHL